MHSGSLRSLRSPRFLLFVERAADLRGAAQAGRPLHAARARRPHAAADGVDQRGLPSIDGRAHGAFENRVHFYGAAATAMRRVLVDHARERGAAKRGNRAAVSIDGVGSDGSTTRLDLSTSTRRSSGWTDIAPGPARVVELRYFGGLSIEETAAAMGMAPATVKRHWAFARAGCIARWSRRRQHAYDFEARRLAAGPDGLRRGARARARRSRALARLRRARANGSPRGSRRAAAVARSGRPVPCSRRRCPPLPDSGRRARRIARWTVRARTARSAVAE